jgi:hypothetical protein
MSQPNLTSTEFGSDTIMGGKPTQHTLVRHFQAGFERSETKVIEVEHEEQPISRLYANFELDQSIHVRTGA